MTLRSRHQAPEEERPVSRLIIAIVVGIVIAVGAVAVVENVLVVRLRRHGQQRLAVPVRNPLTRLGEAGVPVPRWPGGNAG